MKTGVSNLHSLRRLCGTALFSWHVVRRGRMRFVQKTALCEVRLHRPNHIVIADVESGLSRNTGCDFAIKPSSEDGSDRGKLPTDFLVRVFAYAEPHAAEVDGVAAELTEETLPEIAVHLVERINPEITR